MKKKYTHEIAVFETENLGYISPLEHKKKLYTDSYYFGAEKRLRRQDFKKIYVT